MPASRPKSVQSKQKAHHSLVRHSMYQCPTCDEYHEYRGDAIGCCAVSIGSVEVVECPTCDEYTSANKATCEHCDSDLVNIHDACPVCESTNLRPFVSRHAANSYIGCSDCGAIVGPAHNPNDFSAGHFADVVEVVI